MASLHQARSDIPTRLYEINTPPTKAQVYHTDADVIAETAIAAAYTHPEAEAWLTDVCAVIRRKLRISMPDELFWHALQSSASALWTAPI